MPVEDEIREKLQSDGRTDVEIAKAAGLTRVTIAHFKGGRRGLSLDALERLAAVLGLRIVTQAIPPRRRLR